MHTLDFGEPFINVRTRYNFFSMEQEVFPLTFLAGTCGYDIVSVDIADKAILLLNRGAEISCQDSYGDTVLHIVLKCRRFYERTTLFNERRTYNEWSYIISTKAPKDLLLVFITAGADIYAMNNDRVSPSMVAEMYGREDEWAEALEFCGIDSTEVIRHSASHPHDCACEHQTSKLSFKDYCRNRRYDWRYELKLRERDVQRREQDRRLWQEIESDDEEGSQDNNGEDRFSFFRR